MPRARDVMRWRLLPLLLWLVACTAPPARDIRTTVTEITVPGESVMVGNADGSVTITRPGPPPPLSYALALPVVGTGTTTGAGQYAAGVTVAISVAPTPSSAPVQWSGPAPCPQGTALAASLVMPGHALTCTVTVGSAPPPTGVGEWKLIVSGSGVYNWYYNLGAVCPNGDAWIAWNGVTNRLPAGGSAWLTEITTTAMGWRENFAAICTPDNVVQIAPGTSGPQEWSGFVTYGLANKTYTPIDGGGCNAHSALGYDPGRGRLLNWGGWSTNCPIRARPVTSTTWTDLAPSGPVPPLTQDDARETSRRGGVDQRTGDAWVLADDRELYRYRASANAWVAVPTTGVRPPPYVIAALHETANTIVVIGGCDGMNDQDCASTLTTRTWWEKFLRILGLPAPRGGATSYGTWLLDLDTGVWRVGPAQSVEAMPMAKRHAVYDRKAERIVVFTATYSPTWDGKLGTNVWAWTPSAGPTPPPAKVTLTTVAAGTGTGTLTGAGDYAPGATVTLGAIAAAGSTFAGWAPNDPCGKTPSFPMPASALTCTGTFTASGPPPDGDLPPKTFVPRQLPDLAGVPFRYGFGSKDINSAHVTIGGRKTLLLGAGDAGNSGVGDLFTYDGTTNTWALFERACVPATQSPVVMNHPSDRGPFIEDKRGVLWNYNAVPFPDAEGAPCGSGGAIQRKGILARSPQGVWEVKRGAQGSIGGGGYDSTADALLRFEHSDQCSGNPGALVVMSLASLADTGIYPLCLRPEPAWSTATGGWLTPDQPERAFFAWDDAGKRLYITLPLRRLDAAGSAVEYQWRMFVFDMATRQWTMKAPAPVDQSSGVDPNPFHIRVLWDPQSKVVLWPVVADGPCGTIRQLLVYQPTTDTWETYPAPAGVKGNSASFDPRSNALVLAGAEFCAKNGNLHLWRYGP